ncbi:MAG: 30S ribosomal protein S1 [Bacteroidetes bacterium]|nr:30S ribosomal protein S1 [Bacteroidota bacterium]
MTDELNVNLEAENSEEIINQQTEELAVEATNEEIATETVAEAAVAVEEVKAEVAVEEKPAEVAVEEAPAEAPAKKRYVPETISLENFDWNAIGKKQLNYTEAERVQLEEAYDKTFSQIVEREVVDGIVVAKNNREVVVNIGFKSDGVIPLSEVRYNQNLKIGDTIEVYVESQEDLNGQLILSHKKARLLKSWDRVNKAFETQEIITGFVKCRTKGGLIVDVFGIEAFLPGSQIDVKPIRDYDIFVEKNMEFKVVKINHEYKNVVVSHKALIEDEIEQQKADIIAKLEKGQVLEGTVKNITSYGVFIDLGGVDGLIHITDLSWGRINHPEEIVTLDEKINVVILDFDENKKRIALGLKQLTPHPWDALDAKLAVGDKIKGKVVVIADYGAFMEIVPGVEGLIHVSEMSWSQHLRTAHDFLKIGDEVEAIILTLDRDERKMSLGIKQLIPDPWTDIAAKYPLKSQHKAVVRNFTNFGIFVELEEGVDGLIHISDLSWSKKIKHPAEFTKIGDSIEVIVLEVDSENRRLSLGHKQLEENPWEIFETVFTVDSIHKGTIVSSSDKGAIIALPYGVEGFAPFRHLVKADGSNAKVDETIDFKVLEFSKDNKKIIVSHTKIHQDAVQDEKSKSDNDNKRKEKEQKKSVKQNNDNLERSTLGDIEALSNLKSEMQKSEIEKLEAMQKKEEAKKAKKTTAKKEEVEEETTPEAEAETAVE